MSGSELVDGSGWISDESDFYGSAKLRWDLDKKAGRGMKRPVVTPFAEVMAKRVKLTSAATCTPTRPPSSNKTAADTPNAMEPERDSLYKTPSPSFSSAIKAKQPEDVLDFLKSRPQISALQRSNAKVMKSTSSHLQSSTVSDEPEELVEDNRFVGSPAAWQPTESVEKFLKRAPVLDSSTALLGPWLWVGNPKTSRQRREQERKTDVHGFMQAANVKMTDFSKQQNIIEDASVGKAQVTITRKMRPYREQLEDDLLSLAVKHSVTCGKWMFFPTNEDLPRTWRLIAEATAAGRLGPTSKVSTPNPMDPGNVICVYTYDFTDTEDVHRVVTELAELDLVSRDGKPIFYKCDAYTYLDIKSNNPYKIRASLYSSKEILKGEVKAKDDGPLARLKKRSGAIESFLSS